MTTFIDHYGSRPILASEDSQDRTVSQRNVHYRCAGVDAQISPHEGTPELMEFSPPPNCEFELIRAVVEQAPDAIIVTTIQAISGFGTIGQWKCLGSRRGRR